jgi:hypothetical protein
LNNFLAASGFNPCIDVTTFAVISGNAQSPVTFDATSLLRLIPLEGERRINGLFIG